MHAGELSKGLSLKGAVYMFGRFDRTPREILNSLEAEEGSEGVTGAPLEVVTLQDICNVSATSPLRSEFSTQFFLHIGMWKNEEWTMNLVMPLAPSDPLTPAHAWRSTLRVFAERAFEPSGSKTVVQFDTGMEVYMMDPIFLAKELLLGSKSLAKLFHIFTAEDNVEVASLSHFYFKKLMEVYDERGTTEFHILFKMTRCRTRSENPVRVNPDVFRFNDIRDMVLKELDLQSIQNLEAGFYRKPEPPGMQSRKIAMARFRIALVPYFPEPSAFAAIMLQTGTIVGGSTALSIVAGGSWMPGDLDLIVATRYFNRLRDYLVDQGFFFDETLSRDIKHKYGSPRLYKFTYRCFTKGTLKIDVCVCSPNYDDMTPAEFILTYHLSFAMNFVSGEGAYCLFPVETFSGRGYRNKFTLKERTELILAKYAARGYTEILDKYDDSDPDRSVYLHERYPCSEENRIMIGDIENIWCMKLPLSTKENQYS